MKKIIIFSSFFVLPLGASVFMLKDTFKDKFFKKSNNKLDSTRFGSRNYGLEWGSRTDEIIESKLETGDIVLFEMETFYDKIKQSKNTILFMFYRIRF